MNQREFVSNSTRPLDNNINNSANNHNNNSNTAITTNNIQTLPSIANLLTQNTPISPTVLPQGTNHLEIVLLPTNNSPNSVNISTNQTHNNYVNINTTMQQSPPGTVPTRVYAINSQPPPQYIEAYSSDINLQQSPSNANVTLQPQLVTSIISNNNQVYQPQIQPQQQQNIILTQQVDYNGPTPQHMTTSMSPSMLQQQYQPGPQQYQPGQQQYQPSQPQYYFLTPSMVPSQNMVQQPIQISIPTPLSQPPQSKPQQATIMSIEHPPQPQQQQGYYVSQTNPNILAYPIIKLPSNPLIPSTTTTDDKTTLQNQNSPPRLQNIASTTQDAFTHNQMSNEKGSQRYPLYPQMNINETDNKLKLSLDGKTSPFDDAKRTQRKTIVSGGGNDLHSQLQMNISRTNSNDSITCKGEEKIKLVDSNGKVLIKRKLDAKTLKDKQCPICGKKCSRPSILKTHYFIHTGEAPYKCTWPTCGKTFNVKSNMVRHMKSHGNGIPH
ncbi:hypothetical protein C6P44_003634 [Monosporozyma unispora]|nr:hypothetical protein C6P44_003634 [Kazachstania unispora]